MTVSIVVAAAQNGVIGRDNDLPWRLPADLVHFKRLTMGHPIVMGRKTFESIGRPLPGRQNIVITTDKDFQAGGCIIAHTIEEALQAAKAANEVFIIGGSSIFDAAMPLVDKIYLTRVLADVEGDRYFNFESKKWKLIKSEKHPADAKNQYDYEFQIWERQENYNS